MIPKIVFVATTTKETTANKETTAKKEITSSFNDQQEEKEEQLSRAFYFVQDIVSLLEKNAFVYEHQVCLLSSDALVAQAEAMFETQELFRKQERPVSVDIGYHYTQEQNLESLKRNGLLNRIEREKDGIRASKDNGAVYGEGIYTANEPISHTRYGPIGIVVVRLKGEIGLWSNCNDKNSKIKSYQDNNNCIIKGEDDIVILQHSSQCMALFQYRNFAHRIASSQILKDVKTVIDKYFNTPIIYKTPTELEPVALTKEGEEDEKGIQIGNNHVLLLYQMATESITKKNTEKKNISGSIFDKMLSKAYMFAHFKNLNYAMPTIVNNKLMMRRLTEKKDNDDLAIVLSKIILADAKLKNNLPCMVNAYLRLLSTLTFSSNNNDRKKIFLSNAVIDCCQLMNLTLCQCFNKKKNKDRANHVLIINESGNACGTLSNVLHYYSNTHHSLSSHEIVNHFQDLEKMLSLGNSETCAWRCQRPILSLLRCIQKERETYDENVTRDCLKEKGLTAEENELTSSIIANLARSRENYNTFGNNIELLKTSIANTLHPFYQCDQWIEITFQPLQELCKQSFPIFQQINNNACGTRCEIYVGKVPNNYVETRWTTHIYGIGKNVYEHRLCNDHVRIELGQWYHVVLAYHQPMKEITLYVNGHPTSMKLNNEVKKGNNNNNKSQELKVDYQRNCSASLIKSPAFFKQDFRFSSTLQYFPIKYSLMNSYVMNLFEQQTFSNLTGRMF